MKTAHVLDAAGVVTNLIVVADDANPATFDAVFGPDDVGIGWRLEGADWCAPEVPEPSLDNLRDDKVRAINAAADALLSAGAPVPGGLHVAVDDRSRTDLTAMATTATAAASGAITWPDSYVRGWITVENIRIPLATPAAGLALAAPVGDYYAAIVQRRRDLKDAVLAAEDAAALNSINVAIGWPVNHQGM